MVEVRIKVRFFMVYRMRVKRLVSADGINKTAHDGEAETSLGYDQPSRCAQAAKLIRQAFGSWSPNFA